MTPEKFMQRKYFLQWMNRTEDLFSKKYNKPIWKGERGKLLVVNEFGSGDTIMFSRYIHALDLDVLFSCNKELHSLFQQFPVELAPKKHFDYSKVDFVTHLASIPNKIGVKTSGKSYLKGIGNKELETGFNIGICYKGDYHFIPPKHFSNLGGNHFDLTKGMTKLKMGDFNDTACIVEKLDLVITVDTAMAHLAGAIGTPVWVLLDGRTDATKSVDERWKYKGWYDSMQLFFNYNEWENTFKEIGKLIDDYIRLKFFWI